MNKGRPRKPQAQKKIEGTYREDRDNNPIPVDYVTTIPEPPKHLSDMAKVYFMNVCNVLLDMNLLSMSDIVIITQLAQNLEINEMAYDSCKNGGYKQTTNNGYGAVTAAFTAFDRTGKTIRELSNQLGLNPSARERIKMKPKDEEEDELHKILSND